MAGKPLDLLGRDQSSVSGDGLAVVADGQAGQHILVAELGEVCQQLGFSADARLAKANGKIDGDALKKIHLAMVGDAQRSGSCLVVFDVWQVLAALEASF
jgi:hypothetical protein